MYGFADRKLSILGLQRPPTPLCLNPGLVFESLVVARCYGGD